MDPSELGGAAANLGRALDGCGAVQGFLPPSSFLIHVSAQACLGRLAGVPVVGSPAHLPPALRAAPALSEALLGPTPPRVLQVQVPASAQLQGLQEVVARSCGDACTVLAMERGIFTVSSVAPPLCPQRCALAAPASCGCTLPPALLSTLLEHPDVLWVEGYTQPQPFNFHGRAAMTTTDFYNNGLAMPREFGQCPALAGDACALAPLLPFSTLNQFLPSLGSNASRALRRNGQRALQPATQCSAACLTPACGQGFGTCSDGSPMEMERLGLNGVGQLVQVVDSGLDVGSPFFIDPTVQVTPRRNAWNGFAAVASTHRKVEDYWGYADGLESSSDPASTPISWAGLVGHGTHCAGSINGAAVLTGTTPPEDALLGLLSGTAPGARLAVADVGCDTPAGCSLPPGSTSGPCIFGALCIPPYDQLFGSAYDQEARISSNSWGGLTNGGYTTQSASIDAYVHSHPEFLPVFAAANDGFSTGSISISTQAVSKNVLTVGAAHDGLPAHLTKINDFLVEGVSYPAMYQDASPKSCNSVLSYAASVGLQCPTQPTTNAQQCFAAFTSWQGRPVPGFSSQPNELAPYGRDGNMEFPLCCGCSPLLILQGAPTQNDKFTFLGSFAGTPSTPGIYYSRFPSSFSSVGPAQDGRIKPDVTAPGVEIISSRSAGPGTRAYGTFSCGTAPASTILPPGIVFTPATAFPENFVADLVTTLEPIYVTTVGVPYSVATLPPGAAITLRVVNYDRNQEFNIVPAIVGPVFVYTQTFPVTSLSGLAVFTLNFELHAGATVAFQVGFQGLPSITVNMNTDPSTVESTQCFGTMTQRYQMTINFERGGGAAYATPASGTSMATPLVAGAAALARQYFTDGFYSVSANSAGGVPQLTSGFAPSAALLKAILMNSASSLLFNDICTLYAKVFDPPLSLSDCITSLGAPTAAQVRAFGGHGIPSLPRGLSFLSLGGTTRASGALPSLLLPGLTTASRPTPARGNPQVKAPPLTGVDPTLASGASAVYCIDTTTPTATARHPLSATLVWTDPPASVLALTALVNDLDLEVTPPQGTPAATIFGNTNNVSSPMQQRDTLNNAEKLTIELPRYTLAADGTRILPPYTVVVRGSRVPLGPQAFSLVVTGPGVVLAQQQLCSDPAALPPAAAATPATPILSTPAGAALLAVTILLALLLAAAVAYILYTRASRSSSPGGFKAQQQPSPFPTFGGNGQPGVFNPAAAVLELKPATTNQGIPPPPPPFVPGPPPLPGLAAEWK